MRFALSIPAFAAAGRHALGLLASLVACATAPAAEKPNVLLICVDDLKPAIGAFGDPLAKTPNIDKLAARGVVFERAYCNQAVCSPSRNALLTSLRPQSLGIYDLATNFRLGKPDAVTLPEFFRKAGYRSQGMGKIFHAGHGNRDDSRSWSVPYFKPKAETYAVAASKPPVVAGADRVAEADLPRGTAFERADVPDNFYADGQVADEAIRRLDAARTTPNEPFILAVGFIRPHLPFCAPAKYWDMHDRTAFRLPEYRNAPEGSPDYAMTTSGELRRYKNIPARGPMDDELTRDLIHAYYAATSYADAQIGRVLDALERNGLADDTIVVFWGDHGWHLGDHGLWCKHTNYEQAARVPLIVAAPGVAAGRSPSLIETVDIYPTIVELAGLKPPSGLDGISQAAAVKHPATHIRDSIIHVYPRGADLLGRAVRTDRHRLVEWKKFGASVDSAIYELYDYEADPLETRNLAAEQPAVVRFMKGLLASHPEARPPVGRPAPALAATPKAAAKKAAPKKKTDRGTLFTRRDTDGDGRLSRAEFLANQPDPAAAPQRFERFDIDKNGFLSRDEFLNMGRTGTP
jgi:iduronate 2-sulfatase